jgi:hypothetical protein
MKRILNFLKITDLIIPQLLGNPKFFLSISEVKPIKVFD